MIRRVECFFGAGAVYAGEAHWCVSCARVQPGTTSMAAAHKAMRDVFAICFFILVRLVLTLVKVCKPAKQFTLFYHAPSVSNSVMLRAKSSASTGIACRSASAKSVPVCTSV